jgi:hypothetical protein
MHGDRSTPVDYPPPRLRIVLNETRILAGFKVTPAQSELESILKIRPHTQIMPHDRETLISIGSLASELIRISAVYGIFPPGSGGSQWNPQVEAIALAAVTIGIDLEQRVQSLMDNKDVAMATILDAYGSAYVEGAVETIEATIRDEALILGLRSCKRKSPGYHPWPLESQNELFRLLTPRQLGITLTDSNMMVPRKSVTFGIILKR